MCEIIQNWAGTLDKKFYYCREHKVECPNPVTCPSVAPPAPEYPRLGEGVKPWMSPSSAGMGMGGVSGVGGMAATTFKLPRRKLADNLGLVGPGTIVTCVARPPAGVFHWGALYMIKARAIPTVTRGVRAVFVIEDEYGNVFEELDPFSPKFDIKFVECFELA